MVNTQKVNIGVFTFLRRPITQVFTIAESKYFWQ